MWLSKQLEVKSQVPNVLRAYGGCYNDAGIDSCLIPPSLWDLINTPTQSCWIVKWSLVCSSKKPPTYDTTSLRVVIWMAATWPMIQHPWGWSYGWQLPGLWYNILEGGHMDGSYLAYDTTSLRVVIWMAATWPMIQHPWGWSYGWQLPGLWYNILEGGHMDGSYPAYDTTSLRVVIWMAATWPMIQHPWGWSYGWQLPGLWYNILEGGHMDGSYLAYDTTSLRVVIWMAATWPMIQHPWGWSYGWQLPGPMIQHPWVVIWMAATWPMIQHPWGWSYGWQLPYFPEYKLIFTTPTLNSKFKVVLYSRYLSYTCWIQDWLMSKPVNVQPRWQQSIKATHHKRKEIA